VEQPAQRGTNQPTTSGRWLVIAIVGFIGIVVAWGAYLLFVVRHSLR
jgi:hypothetical protein